MSGTLGIFTGGGGPGVCALVGALQAFEDLHIRFDVLSGTSAGGLVATAKSLNWDALALSQLLTGMAPDALRSRRLAWKVPRISLGKGWPHVRFLPSVDHPDKVEALIGRVVWGRTRESLTIPCHVWGCDLNTGDIVDLLDPAEEFSLEQAMAGTMRAPPFLPVLHVGNRRIIDGGVRFNCPLIHTWQSFDAVYILNVAGAYRPDPRDDMLSVGVAAMKLMLADQTLDPLQSFAVRQGIAAGKVRIIELDFPTTAGLLELDHTLIGKGYATTHREFSKHPEWSTA